MAAASHLSFRQRLLLRALLFCLLFKTKKKVTETEMKSADRIAAQVGLNAEKKVSQVKRGVVWCFGSFKPQPKAIVKQKGKEQWLQSEEAKLAAKRKKRK